MVRSRSFYGTVKEKEMAKKRSFHVTVKEKAVIQGKKACCGLRIGVVVRLSVVHAPYV